MKPEHDDLLEKLLRDGFEGPVPDDGFSDRLMRRLPPRRRRASGSLAIAGVCIGAIACWLSLRSASVLQAGWTDWLQGQASYAAGSLLLVVAFLSLMSLGWTLAETED